VTLATTDRLRRLYRAACVVGPVGILVLLAAAYADRVAVFASYLLVWWFLLGIPLGSMVVLCVHNLTGGAWGERIRLPLERALGMLPVTLLLSIPLWFGLPVLYAWARPDEVSASPLLQGKAWYLAPPLFALRVAICFAVWLALAHLLRRYAFARTAAGGSIEARRLRAISALGLLLYAATVTIAAVDWIMSLTPQWHSTTFGLLTGVGQSLAAFAFAVVCAASIYPPRRDDPGVFQDLGNLLLMFVMTWAYLAFTQYLIIWSEDLPREIVWYLPRVQTSWRVLAIVLVVFHFALPFLVLLSRRAKRAPQILGTLAAMLLLARLLDAFWLVAPTFDPSGLAAHWSDLLAVVSLSAIWLALFVRGGSGAASDRSAARPQADYHG
jgi:uncharacterized membrane protein YidH (DUF202 family)